MFKLVCGLLNFENKKLCLVFFLLFLKTCCDFWLILWIFLLPPRLLCSLSSLWLLPSHTDSALNNSWLLPHQPTLPLHWPLHTAPQLVSLFFDSSYSITIRYCIYHNWSALTPSELLYIDQIGTLFVHAFEIFPLPFFLKHILTSSLDLSIAKISNASISFSVNPFGRSSFVNLIRCRCSSSPRRCSIDHFIACRCSFDLIRRPIDHVICCSTSFD